MVRAKLLARTIAARMGYEVIRRVPENDPFSEMKRLSSTSATPIIFDVGAHYGLVARQYRALFPDSIVYAFEPFGPSYERLRASTSSDPGIRSFNFGFAEETGPRPFSSNSLAATNSLLETDARAAQAWGEGLLETSQRIYVDLKSIDDFVDEAAIPSIDILKLDVQGAEYLLLQGAERTIAAGRIKLIYTEMITVPSYVGQKTFDEALTLFREYGFVLHNLYNLDSIDGRLRQVDALFIYGRNAHR